MALQSGHTALSGISARTTDAPITLQPEDYPKPSDEAMEFIETVVPSDFDGILYDDELISTSDTGKELGEFTVTIGTTKKNQQEIFVIHANSHGTIDGVACGTSIIAHVSKTLETIEQQHHEYVKLENHALDRKTIITKDGAEYNINKVVTQGSATQRLNFTFQAENLKGFISEGSNLLLQRLLIKKGVPNNFQAISFDSDANLCPSPYVSLPAKSQTIDGDPVLVCGIQRSIESPTDMPTIWHCYYDQFGHLTSRVQVGSPVVMKVIKVPEAVVKDEKHEKPTFDKQKLIWEDDPELSSKYEDRKEELKDEHAMYVRHHPELKCILADFLQFLLLRKPNDTINFAAEYFASFSTRSVSHGAYATSQAPTPFPPSRTNTITSMVNKQSAANKK